MTRDTGEDMTEKMTSWIPPGRLGRLENKNLCGFIFKAGSPSSGMERVKIYNGRGGMSGRGPGMFAKEFMKRFPILPVEDDGRLHDPNLRENFIERIFTLRRYREAIKATRLSSALVEFQARNKLLMMAHSVDFCRQLGRLTASGTCDESLCREYEEVLFRCLRLPATVAKHVNVLQHIMGYFKKQLNSDEKKELLEIIGEFQRKEIPLIVPVTLLNHYAGKYDNAYLKSQYYLNPHPLELKLRNHA